MNHTKKSIDVMHCSPCASMRDPALHDTGHSGLTPDKCFSTMQPHGNTVWEQRLHEHELQRKIPYTDQNFFAENFETARPRSTSKLTYVLPENKKDPHGAIAQPVVDADGEDNKNHVPIEKPVYGRS